MKTSLKGFEVMLAKEQIIKLLGCLNVELNALGLHGELLLTGGASMCLVHSARDMTKDIDALYEPKAVINQLASKIAQEENVPEGWLNDSVKGFVTGAAPREGFRSLSNLKITTVSTDYLLAMKLISARYGETDYEDIKFLINKLEIRTEEALDEVVMRYYPVEKILPKTGYLIEQLIAETSLQK